MPIVLHIGAYSSRQSKDTPFARQRIALAIIDIDFSKLTQKGNNIVIHQTADKSRRYMSGTHDGITKIIIKDNQIFSDLIIGCSNDSNGLPIEYVYLTITVSNVKGCNLENMTYEEYSAYIESAMQSFLEELRDLSKPLPRGLFVRRDDDDVVGVARVELRPEEADAELIELVEGDV